jgi:hypothetical protein
MLSKVMSSVSAEQANLILGCFGHIVSSLLKARKVPVSLRDSELICNKVGREVGVISQFGELKISVRDCSEEEEGSL